MRRVNINITGLYVVLNRAQPFIAESMAIGVRNLENTATQMRNGKTALPLIYNIDVIAKPFPVKK